MMSVWKFIACTFLTFFSAVHGAIGDRPIIGVLLVTSTAEDIPISGDVKGQPYLFSNYRAFLEQSGAGVVPIFLNQSDAYYSGLLSRVNGVLLPGGDVDAVGTPYGEAAYKIFKAAKAMNDAKNHFPILGLCLGMQEMTTWPFTPQRNLTINVSGMSNVAIPLNFTSAASTSKMYGGMTQRLREILAHQNITPNYHHFGLLLDTYKNYSELRDFYSVTSTNTDAKGTRFVSSMEAKNYPFFGLQWHAEKINGWFRWNNELNHSPDAILICQYVSNFFVNEARKSKQTFWSQGELSRFIIDNYPTYYYPKTNVLSYFFHKNQQMPIFDSAPVITARPSSERYMMLFRSKEISHN